MADWTTDAVDALEQAVTAVREKTVLPAQRGARAIVYGLLVGFFVAVALLMLAVALFRVLVVVTGEVWISYNSPQYLKERHNIPERLLPNIAVVETLAAKASE